MFRKIIFVFLISILFLSCKHNQDADECDELSYRDMVVYYTACGNYIVDDEVIEEDLTDMVRWIQNGGDELIDKGDKKEIGFSIRKDSEYTEFTPSIMSKDDNYTTKDTQFFRHIVEYEDGRISECITSNDRRFGTVLFVSDPIFEKDIDKVKKNEPKKIRDSIILDSIESVANIIDSISEDEINNCIINKEYLEGELSDHYIESCIGPFIKTNWDQEGIVSKNLPIKNEFDRLLGCVATALSQIAIYYGHWPGIESNLLKKMNRPEVPSETTSAYDYFTKQAICLLAIKCFYAVNSFVLDELVASNIFYLTKALNRNGYSYDHIDDDVIDGHTFGLHVEEKIIKSNGPVLVGDAEHCFIADGVLTEIIDINSKKAKKLFVHYNLGWGGKETGWSTKTTGKDGGRESKINSMVWNIKVKD